MMRSCVGGVSSRVVVAGLATVATACRGGTTSPIAFGFSAARRDPRGDRDAAGHGRGLHDVGQAGVPHGAQLVVPVMPCRMVPEDSGCTDPGPPTRSPRVGSVLQPEFSIDELRLLPGSPPAAHIVVPTG